MFINRIINHIGANRRRRQVSLELAELNDRQLADLGLSRFDISGGKRR